MKSNLDYINDCDKLPSNPELLYKFLISGYEGTFGHLLESVIKLVQWGEKWHVNHEHRTLKLLGANLDERTKNLNDTMIAERDKGTFQRLNEWTGEPFPVYGPNKELVLSVERLVAPLFGVLTYGVQMLAYQDNPEGISIWVARRASWKRSYPNMLDSTVGGSLPTGELPFDCLLREGEEEVCLDPELVKQNAIACGTVSYMCLTDERTKGEQGLLSPEFQFCYEMKLPSDMILKPGENEASEIVLLNVKQLKEAMGKGDFAPLTGCLILDFFIRHGILTFENEPNYLEICSRLRRNLELQAA